MFCKRVLISLILYFMANEGNATVNWDENMYPNQILNPMYNENILSLTEELRVDEFVQDSNATNSFTSRGVKQWQNVRIGEETYIIGIREKGISLISLYRTQNSLFQLNEFLVDLTENINCASIFKSWSKQKNKLEAYVILVMKSPSNTVHWYRIKNYKMELVYKWIHDFEIREIIHIEKLNQNNVISFLEYSGDDRFFKMYAYSIEQNIPHIWFLELLPLERYTNSVAISLTRQSAVLATVQSDTKGITFYRYKSNCIENCKFQKYATASTMNAIKVQSFSSFGGKYFAVDGLSSKLLSVSEDGTLQQVAEFRGINQLMVLKVPSSQDVIILGKNASGVEVFTLSKLTNKWINSPAPPCYELGDENRTYQENTIEANQCLRDLQWYGATFIVAGDNPTLIFPGEKVKIVHVMYSLRSISPPSHLDFLWLTRIHQDMQGSWDRLHNGLNSFLNQPTRSRSDSNWDSLCEMTKELDRLTQLVHNSRLKLNAIQCSPNEFRPVNGDTEDVEDINNGISFQSENIEEEEDSKGKDKSRLLNEIPVTPLYIKEETKFSRTPPYTKISTDMDDISIENHDNLEPLHIMIHKLMN